MRTWLALLLLSYAPSVFASSDSLNQRSFDLLLGAGVSHDSVSLSSGDLHSRFEGWAPVIDVAMEIPFSDRFGFFLGGEGRTLDLFNPRTDAQRIEKASSLSAAARAGFFYGAWAFGYGMGFESMKIRQVSVATGVTETQLRGSSRVFFGSYSFSVNGGLRLGLEGFYRSGQLDAYDYADYGGMMKLSFVLGGG